MIRVLSRLCLILALFGLATSAATACIWDRLSETHEKEFKSDYLRQSPGEQPNNSDPAPAGPSWNVVALSGLGTAMIVTGLVTGTVMVVRRR